MSARAGEPHILPAAAPRAIEWAVETLVEGGVIAIPTDTVYGLAGSIFSAPALNRIYEIKGRPRDRSLPVLVSSIDALARLTEPFDERIASVLDRFWPGPLTVVLPARHGFEEFLVSESGGIGVRMPNHPLALEVIGKAGGAIACTSANRSGEPPALSAAEVAATIGTSIDLTLDGGRSPGGVASTVIAIADDRITVLREGAVPESVINALWSEICGID
jgi:L-threonylcarbamoyladenylate synthase